jgi:predicted DNA-binding WGR domain protein
MARREFHFTEGTSNKFWIIELEGDAFTVRFGRIGTDGQTQEKEFGTEAEALKAYEKLIAEKIKKGYEEVGAACAATGSAKTHVAKAPKTKKAGEPKKIVAEEPKPETETQAAAVVSTEVVRRLHLSAGQRALKTAEILQRPEPRPFDRDACLKMLASVTKGDSWQTGWNWQGADIPESMTREEADFWLHALLQERYNNAPRAMVKEMAGHTSGGEYSAKKIRDSLRQSNINHPIIMAPIANLLTAEEIFDWIADLLGQYAKQQHAWGFTGLLDGFSLYVRPYLSEKQLKALRKRVADSIDLNAPWPDHYHPLPFDYYMAAALGMTKEVKQVVARMTDTTYGKSYGWSNDFYQQPQFVVLRLGDAATVEAEMRRLKLLLRGPEQIRAWLAVTEWNALDLVRDSILDVGKREEVESLIVGFGKAIEATEAAVTMLELKLQSKAPNAARQWLDQHLGCAIAGLIPLAAGKGKLADAALDFLREKKRQGHAPLIAKLLAAAPAECAARVRSEVLEREEKVYKPLDASSTPAWWKKAVTDLKAAKVPDWLPLSSLPPILVGEHRLNDEQVGLVIAALQKSTLEREHTLFTALRQNADAEALDAFAWAVFDNWLSAGAPSKDKWGMLAIGFLGGDRSVLKITPLIRAWPGESQHQRAVLGLQCLRKVGSDAALMQLNGIAQKLKFKGLKEAAARFMEEIATDKGLTRAQLEDRIVPDCDLDERGSRLFDFGPRSFRFVLGPQLKPMLKDEAGAVKTDLPKPNAKDDGDKANQAVQEWKLLKKQVGEVAKIQSVRLEQALVTGRRWPAADFQTLLVRHPLMINLVRLLLWGVYDDKGNIKKTFRVTEDHTFAEIEDKEFKLAAGDSVGLVHPLQLKEEDKAAWGEILSDYEILPPFPQLGRPTYALEKEEANAAEITRFANIKIPPQSLVFGLEKLGWTRGPAMDAGSFNEHIKQFPGPGVTAVVTYQPGMSMGYMEGAEEQMMDRCFFLEGMQKGEWYRDSKGALKLQKIDKVVLSEVLGDLEAIAAKGK